MAVNLYDQPAQAQFANTYSPIPFSEIVAAGQSKQQHYDVNRTGFERMAQEAEDLYAIPTSEDEAYIRRAQSFMQDLSDKYATQDYGNPEVVNEINRAIRQNVNRRQVQEIQQSHSAWEQNQKIKAELKSKGLYDERLDEPYAGYSTAKSGVYTYQTPALLNNREKKETYFNNLEASSIIRGDQIIRYIDNSQIDKLAKAGLEDYIKSSEGKQDILLYRKTTGDYNTSDNELGYKLLFDTGQEKKYRLQAGFVPEYISGSDRNKQQYPAVTPSFFSSEERFPEQYSNYKKAKSSVKEYRAQREQLESSLNVARKSKNPEAIQQAEQNLQILDNANAGLESIYQDVYNRASRDFNKSKVEHLNVFKKNLSGSGLTKEEINRVADVASEYFSDKGAFSDLYETGDFTQAFQNKYGPNDPVIKKLSPNGIIMSKVMRNIRDYGEEYRGNIKDIESKIDEKAYNIYDAEVSKGINREYFSFPVDNESKKVQTIDGKEVASNAYRVAEQLKLNANSFEIEPITGGGRLSERQRGKMLEQAYGASSGIDILGASPSDSKYGYLVVKVKDSEGKPVADDNKNTEFRLYLNNPSQMQAIAMDYAMQGNYELAIRFAQPAIEKQVEMAFENGNRPNTLTIQVPKKFGSENVTIERDNDDKDIYYLRTPGGIEVLEGRAGIKQHMYNRLQSNLNQQ